MSCGLHGVKFANILLCNVVPKLFLNKIKKP